MAVFALRNVTYSIEDKRLLGPISLDIPGEGITALLGANGAGKSLLLSLCHGMITPDGGQVTWAGEDVVSTRAARGFIFQKPAVLQRSVIQNVEFPLIPSTLAPKERIARAERLLGLVKLKKKAKLPAAVLSGGEAQLMALARALVPGPKSIIMDEATSALDPNATQRFEEIVMQVAGAGVSMLWATHDIAQAKRCANYVIFLEEGYVVEHGPATSFFEAPVTAAAQRYLAGQFHT